MFTRGYLICAYPSWWYADASMNYPAEPHSEVWKRETARLRINIKPAEQIQHTTHNFTSKHVCTWICQVLMKCGFQLHFISTWYTLQNIYKCMCTRRPIPIHHVVPLYMYWGTCDQPPLDQWISHVFCLFTIFACDIHCCWNGFEAQSWISHRIIEWHISMNGLFGIPGLWDIITW